MPIFNPFASLSETAAAIKQRRLSPVDAAQAYLERIQLVDPHVNSFITVTADAAMKAARKAEAEIQTGLYRGPLHGIPLTLKDLYETAGIATTHGSKVFAGYVPDQDRDSW